MALVKSGSVVERDNIVSIQFLRFVAATSVVLFHSTQAMNLYFKDSISKLSMNVTELGAAGVHIFFVISGFIMVYTSFYKKTDKFSGSKFITKRFIRIYPIYFIYSAFYLYFYHFVSSGKNLSLEQLFGSLLLLPGYSSLIIGPGWTLSYEVYFYICFCIAMTLGLMRGLFVLTSFFIGAIALNFVLDTTQSAIHVATNTLLIEFLLGAWVGCAVVSSVRVGNTLANAMVAGAFVIFLAGVIFGYTRLPSMLTWGIPSALLVAGLVFKEKNSHVPFVIRNLSFLGDSSYSLYLLHIVLIDAVILLAIYVDGSIGTQVPLIGATGMVIICFAITTFCIAIAHGSYKLIERRVVGSLQGFYRRRIATLPGKPQVG